MKLIISTLENDVKMHIDGESFKLFGNVNIELKFMNKVNVVRF